MPRSGFFSGLFVSVVVAFIFAICCFSSEADYIPISTDSPHFCIKRRRATGFKSTTDTVLPLFAAIPKEESKIFDLVCN